MNNSKVLSPPQRILEKQLYARGNFLCLFFEKFYCVFALPWALQIHVYTFEKNLKHETQVMEVQSFQYWDNNKAATADA